MRIPDYTGGGLVNLIATLERRLTGEAPSAGLANEAVVPAGGYVLLVIDGLGAHQLDHPVASDFATARAATLTAGLPTTTTTSMATVATGLAPAAHGIAGHILRLPGVAGAVNVLKWVTPQGDPVEHDYSAVLPSPNLWERLARAGVEPITVQPGSFLGSPLSRMLYRGCRFEPAWSREELAEATLAVAAPGRLVVTYYPNVDVAAHVHGQTSEPYRMALAGAVELWERLCLRLPADVGLVATSDHGHLDYGAGGKLLIRHPRYDSLQFWGDPRSTWVAGDERLVSELAAETGAKVVDDFRAWLGPGPDHPDLAGRVGEYLLLPPPGRLLLPRGFDKRLIGYHGGLEPAEVEVPLLVR